MFLINGRLCWRRCCSDAVDPRHPGNAQRHWDWLGRCRSDRLISLAMPQGLGSGRLLRACWCAAAGLVLTLFIHVSAGRAADAGTVTVRQPQFRNAVIAAVAQPSRLCMELVSASVCNWCWGCHRCKRRCLSCAAPGFLRGRAPAGYYLSRLGTGACVLDLASRRRHAGVPVASQRGGTAANRRLALRAWPWARR